MHQFRRYTSLILQIALQIIASTLTFAVRLGQNILQTVLAPVRLSEELTVTTIYATGSMLANAPYRFAVRICSIFRGACEGFISLLRSLQATGATS